MGIFVIDLYKINIDDTNYYSYRLLASNIKFEKFEALKKI